MADSIKLLPNHIITLKKKHPCGNSRFRIVRIGSDVRIICQGCGRDMIVDRVRLEKIIRKIESPQGIQTDD